MKRYAPTMFFALSVLIVAGALMLSSQTAPTTPAGPNTPSVVYVSTDPTGSCTMNNIGTAPVFITQNVNTGLRSYCVGGTWINGELAGGWQVADATDTTKKIKLTASGASTSTTLTLADAVTASRTITIADPGGAATLAYTNPTSAQALSGTTISQTGTVPFTVFTTPPAFAGTGSLTSTTDANGTEWWSQIYIPTSFTATGICAMMGTTPATDKWIGIVWNGAGTVVANSAVAGQLFATPASSWNCQAFSPGTVALTGPATYFIGLQGNGTTANEFYTYGTGFGQTGFITGNVAGTFATVANITPGTSYNAGKGPVMSLY